MPSRPHSLTNSQVHLTDPWHILILILIWGLGERYVTTPLLLHSTPWTEVIFTVPPKVNPPASEYSSAWEKLLRDHAVHGASTIPAQEQSMRQSPASPTAGTSNSFQTVPSSEPQHPYQKSQQPQPKNEPKSYVRRPRVQRAGASPAQGLRGVVTQREYSNSTMPAQSQRLNLHPPAPLNQNTAFPVSTFALRAPARGDYLAQRIPRYEDNPHPTPTRHVSNARTLARPMQSPAHTLGQSSTAPDRLRMYNFHGHGILILTNTQGQ